MHITVYTHSKDLCWNIGTAKKRRKMGDGIAEIWTVELEEDREGGVGRGENGKDKRDWSPWSGRDECTAKTERKIGKYWEIERKEPKY